MKQWECEVCGYIHEGDEPPEECPVCSAEKGVFVEVAREQTPAETTEAPGPQPAVLPSLPAKIYALSSTLTTRHHLHPIVVHTPNGVVPMALVFMLITLWFGLPLYETAAWYSLIFVLNSMPLVLFTGYLIWRQRYRGAFNPIFKIKIAASVATVVLLLGLIIWRAAQPDIITTASAGRWIYLGACLLLVGVVGVAGHFGGRLVFANRKE